LLSVLSDRKSNVDYFVSLILILLVNVNSVYAKANFGVEKELNFASIDYCPFTCDPDKENGKEGIMIEVLRLSLEPIGYRVKFDIMPYSRAIAEVKLNNYDGIAVVIKSHAPSFIYPELPTLRPRVGLYIKKERNLSYSSTDSLKNSLMVVVQDYKYDNANFDAYIARNKGNKARILSLTGNNTVERALKSILFQRADVYLENQLSVAYYATGLEIKNKIQLIHSIPSDINDYSAFSPTIIEAKYLSIQLSSTIKELYETGKMNAIFKKYGVVSSLQE